MPLQNMSSENPIVRLRPVSRYLENKSGFRRKQLRRSGSGHLGTSHALQWPSAGAKVAAQTADDKLFNDSVNLSMIFEVVFHIF